ncbi:MAG: fibronectin type III domain-containing protein, partial [Lachnospiraceae bacterium]|nr:fibronectin type III domain-containing protein [Lachnospiraceae bacterium]
MKKVKRMLQVCLGMLAVVAVVGLGKMDAKAAAQVTGLKQTYSGTNYAEVEWNYVPHEDYSIISYHKQGESGWKSIRNDYTGDAYIGDLIAGSSYIIKVNVYDENDNQVAGSGEFECVTAPGKCTSFGVKQVDAGVNSVKLSWNACPGANYYVTEYWFDGNEKQVPSNTTSVVIKGLKKNTDFYGWVRACRKSASGYVAEGEPYQEISAVVKPSDVDLETVSVLKYKKYDELSMLLTSSGSPDGAQIEIRTVKGNKKITTINAKSASIDYKSKKKLFRKNELYKLRYRCYNVASDGKKYYGSWSSYKSFSHYDVIKSVKSKGSKGIQVKWNKIAGASGYKIYASNKSDDKGYKLVATVKKGSTTSTYFKKYNKKALKKGKTYYIYVKPYYKDGKKIVEAENTYSYIWTKSTKYKK